MLTVDQVFIVSLAAVFMLGTACCGAAVSGRPPRARHAAGGLPPVEGARSAGAGALLPTLEDRWRAADGPVDAPLLLPVTPRPFVPDPGSPAPASTAPITPIAPTSVGSDRTTGAGFACRVCRDGHEVVGVRCFRCGTTPTRPFALIGDL